MSPSNDLQDFLSRRHRWGVAWKGAHFVGFAMNDTQGTPSLMLGSLVCLTDGVEPPCLPDGRFVDVRDAVAVSVHVPEEQLPGVLTELAQGDVPAAFNEAFGRSVVLPFRTPGKPDGWYVDVRARYGDGPRVYAQRNAGGDMHKVFGFECIDRARTVLLSSQHGPAIDGLTDLAKQLHLERRTEFSNSSHPVFDIVAPIPLKLLEFRYDKVSRAYRVDLECGASIRREAGLVALVPGPRAQVTLAQCEEVRRRRDMVTLRAIFPGPRGDQKLNATVIYREEVFFEATVDSTPQFKLMGKAGAKDEWMRKFEKTFDRSGAEFHARIRRLTGRAAPAVLARAREAVEFLDQKPFYSIVAAASVAEALLRVRLRRYGATRANQVLVAAGGKKLSGAPGRIVLGEAIEVCQRLGIIARLDTHAAHLLREARNFIHVELGPRGQPRYSEAEAIEAFLAVLRVLDSLSRSTRQRRRVSSRKPTAAAPPAKTVVS
ncbi:hypothetical protein ACOQFB_03575 [Anaeromyxobacter sp. Red801]|uniref:hypothetical protein n=1 Tax=Anaeromyxobacter sp. Red801 TaxID=3411632 RepID=UPI003B9E0111